MDVIPSGSRQHDSGPLVKVNGNGNAEEAQIKEYGKIVLWGIKHKAAIFWVLTACYSGYQFIQTMKRELVDVKKDVAEIKANMFTKAEFKAWADEQERQKKWDRRGLRAEGPK